MLVLCVGMYRACSTWQYGVAAQLLERHRVGRRLGFADGDQFVSELEPTLEPSDWSILKAHNAHAHFGELLAEGRALAIYSHRDLRDVAFSWMHKTGVTFEEIVRTNFLQLCLHNDWYWRARPGVLFQSYEDLIAEPVRGVEEIAEHLGIELEDGEAQEMAEAFSLESNRKKTDALSERLQADGVALDSKDLDHYDPQTLLHWNHLRSGRAGAWRDVATPEQKATIARICGPWLVEHGYEDDQAWAEPLEWEPLGERLPRISYARNSEDILLDRLFRGQIGTFVGVGADHPMSNNATFYFYLRDWRGVNVGQASDLFTESRPEDLNVSGVMADLFEQHGLVPPDLFSIQAEADAEQILRDIPLTDWQPRVFVIESTRPTSNHEAWEPILLEQGYLFAAFDGINRFYLRGDQADALSLFECPVNALDHYMKADTFEQRTRANTLESLLDGERKHNHEIYMAVAVDLAEMKARFGDELDARHRDYVGWLAEREGWRVEREAWQAEREAWQAERLAAQVEREVAQAERQTEREVAQADRDELARRIGGLEGDRDALVREVEALRGEIARLEGVVHERDVEINQITTRLRPYLKIDRLGVVTALQRKVHAHRAHSRG